LAIEATGQESGGKVVQPGQDRPWVGMGFRMEAIPGSPPAAAQPGQGAPDPQNGQQPTNGTGGDTFREFFSDISDEQWPQVEPHLRNVQAHVTRLEQVAKPFIEAGVSPDESVALLNFAQAYSQDPVGTWLNQAQALMQNGSINPDELDFDELVSIVTGQPNPNAGPEGQGQPGPSGNPEVAALEARLAQAEESLQYFMQERQQDQTRQQSQQQKTLLDKATTTVKEELTKAGVPHPADTLIVASIIANKGNPNAVVQDLTGFKGTVLSSLTESRQEPGSPRMPRGAPQTPAPKSRPGGRRDAFAGARASAEQYLKSQNEAAAQEV
jgi:hypothetical protein